ncbi:MAG: hypothetical protein NTX42_04905 [Methanothrix sp.]|nr:hypothetical protein [Methanothrix sp.]
MLIRIGVGSGTVQTGGSGPGNWGWRAILSRSCWSPGETGNFAGRPVRPGLEWFFPGWSFGHQCTKTMLRTIDRLAEEAGVQEVSRRHKLSRRMVTPHILLHSHVVNALMAGVPVPMIQKPGGAQRGFQRRGSTPRWRWPLVKEAYDLHGFGPVGVWI